LNVLAQRRYRLRRKEHVRNLEAEAGVATKNSKSTPPCSKSTVKTSSFQLGGDDSEEPPSDESIESALEAFTQPNFNFQPVDHIQQHQDELFDDPFASFDHSFVAFPSDIQAGWNVQFPSLPASPRASTEPSATTMSLTPLTSPASSLTPYSFPDERNFDILELNILRGAMAIAKTLKIDELVWSLTATSPFTSHSMSFAQFQHLPLSKCLNHTTQ
jgi:hypothetical protein